MGSLQKLLAQTRRPEGRMGELVVSSMNWGHAKLADWGMEQVADLRPERIADLGCGGGRNVSEMLRRYPDATVTALDYAPLCVSATEEKNRDAIDLGRCRVVQGSVDALPLPGQSFDLVTAFETVYFWPEPERSFAQVLRIMKPGGTFLIVHESNGKDLTGRLFARRIEGMTLYTPERLVSLLEEAGFTDVCLITRPKKPWMAIRARREETGNDRYRPGKR